MKTRLSIILPLLVLIGCASLQKYAPAIQEASRIGTQEALRDRPEWREKFAAASQQLRVLSRSTNVTVLQLLTIIRGLPVSELSSDAGRWTFDGVTLLVAFAGANVEISKPGQVAEFASAVANGIDDAIAHPLPVPLRNALSPRPVPKHYKIKVSK